MSKIRMSEKNFGDFGERIAEKYLTQRSHVVIKKNYRTRYGEVDLICTKDDVTIFVEVKTRRSGLFGYPEDAISKKKMRRLVVTATHYMVNRYGPWQIDVLAIMMSRDGRVDIRHFPNCIY